MVSSTNSACNLIFLSPTLLGHLDALVPSALKAHKFSGPPALWSPQTYLVPCTCAPCASILRTGRLHKNEKTNYFYQTAIHPTEPFDSRVHELFQVSVYASNPWHMATSGKIRNLVIHEEREKLISCPSGTHLRDISGCLGCQQNYSIILKACGGDGGLCPGFAT